DGYSIHRACFISEVSTLATRTASFTLSVLWPPLSLSLPHKGGGNAVAPLRAPPRLGLRVRVPTLAIGYLYMFLCHDSHSAPQRVLLEGRVATRELARLLPTLTRPGPVTVACSVFLDCTLSTLMRSPCAPVSSA